MAVDLVYLALMAFVFARPLDAWLAGFPALAGEHSLLRLLALLGIVIGLHVLVSLPLSFVDGYVVEHRFGLSNQSLRRWVRNWVLRNGLALVLGGADVRRPVLDHVAHRAVLVADRGGGVLRGERDPGTARAGRFSAVVLQDRADRECGAGRADAATGRRHRTGDRGRVPAGAERRYVEGQRDAGRAWAGRGGC